MEEIRFSNSQFGEILSDVCARGNEEACGLVAGLHGVAIKIYPITNCLHSRTRYLMDGNEQVRAMLDIEQNGLELIGIYHSHLKGRGEPSEIDKQECTYPDVVYLIMDMSGNTQSMRGFRLIECSWVEIPVVIMD